MKIFTLWHEGDDGEAPWFVDAVDEYTVDSLDTFPPEYKAAREQPKHRELIIDVPDTAVQALFEPPQVSAKVIDE